MIHARAPDHITQTVVESARIRCGPPTCMRWAARLGALRSWLQQPLQRWPRSARQSSAAVAYLRCNDILLLPSRGCNGTPLHACMHEAPQLPAHAHIPPLSPCMPSTAAPPGPARRPRPQGARPHGTQGTRAARRAARQRRRRARASRSWGTPPSPPRACACLRARPAARIAPHSGHGCATGAPA